MGHKFCRVPIEWVPTTIKDAKETRQLSLKLCWKANKTNGNYCGVQGKRQRKKLLKKDQMNNFNMTFHSSTPNS